MASILNLHTFYFFLIVACSFLEIYGKGFGGSRGGGYSSRGSSSSRSSSGSSYKPSSSHSSKPSSSHSSRPSNSHSSKPSSSHSSRPSSSGSSGSSIKRGSSFPIIPVPVYNNHRNRMYGGSSNLGWNNNDYVRKSPNHYESKIDDTETRSPPAPRYTTSRPWNIVKVNPPSGSWRREPGRRFESLPPSYQREMQRIYAVSKEMQDLQEPFANRRHRFQKRHACEGSQCIHEERREIGDDASAVNNSPSLDILGNIEAKEGKPRHLATDSQVDQKTQPNVM